VNSFHGEQIHKFGLGTGRVFFLQWESKQANGIVMRNITFIGACSWVAAKYTMENFP